MRFVLMCLLCPLSISQVVFAVTAINDPLQDYLNYQVERLTNDDSICTLTVDFNEDGVPDYFYSSTAPGDKISRQGAKYWWSFLSTDHGFLFPIKTTMS